MAILLLVTICLTLIVAAFSWTILPSKACKVTFSAMLLILAVYKTVNYFIPGSLLDEWIVHVIFFISQITFYIFTYHYTQIISDSNPKSQSSKPSTISTPVATNLSGFLIAPGVPTYLSEQGIMHILTVPIFLLCRSALIYRLDNFEQTKYRPVIKRLILASGLLVLIHVGEFIVESQHWLSIPQNIYSFIEYAFFIAALAVFTLALLKHKEIHSV